MTRTLAYSGEKFRIVYARDRVGASPSEAFLQELSTPDQAKMVALFRRFGDTGNFMNKQKFRDLGQGLYEFKSHQIRMIFSYCKVERAVVVLTHGFVKKQDKTPKEEIDRALRIFDEDQAWLLAKGPHLVRKAGR